MIEEQKFARIFDFEDGAQLLAEALPTEDAAEVRMVTREGNQFLVYEHPFNLGKEITSQDMAIAVACTYIAQELDADTAAKIRTQMVESLRG